MGKREVVCLGVEGTAHTFGIGIVNSRGDILADVRFTYRPKKGEGIVPHEARKHHERIAQRALRSALSEYGKGWEQIDLIAYSCGPGLPPPLLFTASFAENLSREHKKPLVRVSHAIAHIEIGRLITGAKDPVVAYLSGGHNAVIAFAGGRYRVFGETQDITCGNCLDVVARKMGLGFPGGPEIEKLARKGKNYLELPYVVKGMDVSYSGMLTSALKLLERGVSKEDLAFSLQETCFAMIVEVVERAMAHLGKEEALLVGGVAANRRLQEMMKVMCDERGARFFVVPAKYSSDNGVMIAWTGILAYLHGWKPGFEDKIKPRWRLDEVDWFL